MSVDTCGVGSRWSELYFITHMWHVLSLLLFLFIYFFILTETQVVSAFGCRNLKNKFLINLSLLSKGCYPSKLYGSLRK